jgi:hypothetical protein
MQIMEDGSVVPVPVPLPEALSAKWVDEYGLMKVMSQPVKVCVGWRERKGYETTQAGSRVAGSREGFRAARKAPAVHCLLLIKFPSLPSTPLTFPLLLASPSSSNTLTHAIPASARRRAALAALRPGQGDDPHGAEAAHGRGSPGAGRDQELPVRKGRMGGMEGGEEGTRPRATGEEREDGRKECREGRKGRRENRLWGMRAKREGELFDSQGSMAGPEQCLRDFGEVAV